MPTEPQEQAPESCLHHAFHSIGRVGHIARGVSDRSAQSERLRKLPVSCLVPTNRLHLAAGHVTFIRRASVAGDRDGAEPVVPDGDEASGSIPAPAGGYRSRDADDIPQHPRPRALVPPTAKRITDT